MVERLLMRARRVLMIVCGARPDRPRCPIVEITNLLSEQFVLRANRRIWL
jgi:hypothetical protein